MEEMDGQMMPGEVRTFLSQPLHRIVVVCALPLILCPLLQYLAIAPFGSDMFLWLEMFIILPLMAGLLALVISPFLLLIRRFRRLVFRCLIAASILTAATLIGLSLGGRVRMAAFHRLAERSRPLVRAIQVYESRHGSPPPDLAALVPGYLPAIPGTGMAAYPRYEYQVGQKATRYEGNPWVLVVFTPSGGINFDQFMYFPLQNYPQSGYGGSIERIADWAYVHE
jgi:hypothetical protein